MAVLAEAVANGKLNESVLIAAWAAREGRVEYYTYGMWGGDECLNKFDSIGVAQDNLDRFDHEAEYGIIIKLGP
jgi:membrane protein DedA with SNARE-associated domain